MRIVLFIVYQIAQIITVPAVLVYLLIRKIKGKSVLGSFWERKGFVPKTPRNKKVIWIHAVSVGEVLSIQHLITKIKRTHPSAICYLTVGTLAGKKIAQEKLTADYVSFLPYDYLVPMLIAYHRIKPKHICIIEAEIWPNFLLLAHFKKIPVYAINARISKRSRKRYHTLKRLLLPLLQIFTRIYTQSAYDTEEFKKLGVSEDILNNLGDIKAYNVLQRVANPRVTDPRVTDPRVTDSRVSESQPQVSHEPLDPRPVGSGPGTLLVGSVHPGEIDVYIKLYKTLKSDYPELRLIVAPRHFFWKQELIEKVQALGYPYAVWDETNSKPRACDILLVCKIGELFDLYPQATIFFLGGTFVPVGGHNLLEPAVWGTPTIIGPYHHNCQVIANALKQRDGIRIVQTEQELINTTAALLKDRSQLTAIGQHAHAWIQQEGKAVEAKLTEFVMSLQ